MRYAFLGGPNVLDTLLLHEAHAVITGMQTESRRREGLASHHQPPQLKSTNGIEICHYFNPDRGERGRRGGRAVNPGLVLGEISWAEGLAT